MPDVSRDRHVSLHLQMRLNGMDLRRTQRSRMPLVMEEDDAVDPVNRGSFGTQAVMFEANFVAHEVKAFRLVVHPYTTMEALERGHQGPAPLMAIGQVGQVHVARQQVHVQHRHSTPSPTPPAHPWHSCGVQEKCLPRPTHFLLRPHLLTPISVLPPCCLALPVVCNNARSVKTFAHSG
jgi:hypothetical protein